MTYMLHGNEHVAVGSIVNGFIGREIPENKMQFCCPESDARIRALIRGMDNRERLIVLDEINRINGEGANSI